MIVKISEEEELEIFRCRFRHYRISPNLINHSIIIDYFTSPIKSNYNDECIIKFKSHLTLFEIKKVLETKVIIEPFNQLKIRNN